MNFLKSREMRKLYRLSRLSFSLVLICLYSFEYTQRVSSFWFTDNSLNYSPAQVNSMKIENGPTEANTNKQEKQSPFDPVTQVSYSIGESFQKRSQNDSWISPTPRTVQFNGQLGSESGQQCQCSIDLIHNYTNSFISRWLGSPNAASQLRATLLSGSLSNSTGANINRRPMHLASPDQMVPLNSNSSSNSIRNNNHLSAWIRPRFHSSSGNNNNSLQQQHHQNGQRQLLTGTALRGPQGPRGEIGARGERGRPGFVRVRDRDALFDLANTSSAFRQNDVLDDSSSPGLVFVDSEQMLVVLSASGWRPVQLLPAIHDFRRAIAKFSLNSSNAKRKLLTLSTQTTAEPRLSPVSSRPEAQQIRQVFGNGIFGDASAPSLVSDAIASDLDDEDDDDEDDEDDEDAETNQDDEDEDEDEQNDEVENSTYSVAKTTKSAHVDASNENLIGSSSVKRPVIMGRSATSTSMVAREMAALLPADPSPTQDEKQNENDGERSMKLRVAALNEPFSGNVHGIRGADFECRRNAAKANIKGSFRAFLASGFQNLNEVVRYNVLKYPLVNLRGETLANSWHDFFKQPARILNPLSKIYSFDGRHVASDSNWPNKLVWHGANNKFGFRDSLHNCDGWRSDSLSKFGFATPIHSPPHNLNRRLNIKQQLKQRKRSLDHSSLTSDQRQHNHRAKSNGFILDTIDKYPCRMPLVMLCIETIGQQVQPIKQQKHLSFESSEDMENVIS